jgi:hypothetical protein
MGESNLFWDQLLQLIEEGRVTPVLGQDLLQLPPGSEHPLLYPYLAARLADYLGVPSDNLPEGGELNEVAGRYMAGGGPVEEIYPALKQVAGAADKLSVPEPLRKLAAIRPLRLFLTTAFDGFLERALNDVRFGGARKTHVVAHAPNEVNDLSADALAGTAPVVFHLLGKLSATPAYAVTQEDLIEYFHSLNSEMRRMPVLFDELNRKGLLILGSRFGPLLVSFLMRFTRRQRLSIGGRIEYLADRQAASDREFGLFVQRFSRGTKIFRGGGAVEFVNELSARWSERHPVERDAETRPALPEPAGIAPGCVFLSYASEDVEAARALHTALEAEGVDTFFDKDGLRSGDSWDPKLKRLVNECSVFVPVISKSTLTVLPRFFRVEWNLALERANMTSFSDESVFLLPVVIDDTSSTLSDLPPRFRAVQWTRLPGGQPTPDFLGRVKQAYRRYLKALDAVL